MLIQEPIQAAIWHALNHYAYSDAILLSERLYAEVNTDEALFLLATSYYRSGKPMQAYTLLQAKGCPTPQCKYLLAKCCTDLNKLGEVENTLIENCLVKSKDLDLLNEFGEITCFVLSLLGKLYSKTERHHRATEAYTKSLKLNPFLWSSFEALCQLGHGPDATQVFQLNSLDNFYHCQSSYPPSCPRIHVQNNDSSLLTNSELQEFHLGNLSLSSSPMSVIKSISENNSDIFSPDSIHPLPPSAPLTVNSNRARPKTGRSFLGGLTTLNTLTPSFGILPLGTPISLDNSLMTYLTPPKGYIDTQGGDPKAPSKKLIARRGQNLQITKPPVFSQSGNSSNTNITRTPSPNPSIQSVTNVRRSTRLFSNANSVKENNKGSNKTRFTSPKAPLRKPKTRSNKTTLSQPNFNEMNERNKPDNILELSVSAQQQAVMAQKAAAEGLMQLLREMGTGYAALSQFNCRKAIDIFSKLPLQHYKTGWVLSQLGRAHFELSDYHQAVYLFSEVRNIEPYHLVGMEYFSTSLWHLQKEVTLSALAQALIDMDSNAPQAWCAMGNCFSLQKEHDTAIKFFQRAVQVDPNFAYAYTLLGHEYVLTEELDKAISCFRNAIRIDSRHYNAWYGVGMIYYKQEKFQLAEVHFKKALMINPQSSVLMCHIGVVQHALQKSECALSTLNKAIAVDPTNPLCKFHRASILFASDHHQEALKELEQLKEIVPKESLVYFLTGKVHKKLGNTHLALMNFSWAMDLDPKGANNQIKEAIDKRYVNDDDDVAAQANNSSVEDLHPPEQGESQESSVMDAEEMQLQAMESDESL